MITCRELVDALDQYISGEMPPAQILAFEEHLAVCPNCVHYIDSYRMTVALGKAVMTRSDAPAVGVPEGLVQAVLQAVQKGT